MTEITNIQIADDNDELIDFVQGIQLRHGDRVSEMLQDMISDELTLILSRLTVPEEVAEGAAKHARGIFERNREQFMALIAQIEAGDAPEVLH